MPAATVAPDSGDQDEAAGRAVLRVGSNTIGVAVDRLQKPTWFRPSVLTACRARVLTSAWYLSAVTVAVVW